MKIYVVTRSTDGKLEIPEVFGEREKEAADARYFSLTKEPRADVDVEVRIDVFERVLNWFKFDHVTGIYPKKE